VHNVLANNFVLVISDLSVVQMCKLEFDISVTVHHIYK